MKTFKRFAPCFMAAVLGFAALPAAAAIHVRFIEGAPKDRFEITNRAACALRETDVVIDLRSSAAGLVFDVTAQGAGVEVFQPLEIEAGADALTGVSRVVDGDRQIVLSIRSLAPAARIAFTIDVDDTLGPRGITVSGSEIEGAAVRLDGSGISTSGRFSSLGETVVPTPACR